MYFYYMTRVLIFFWRIWFYFLTAIPVIIMFPFLTLFLMFPNGYRPFFWVARHIWSRIVLLGMGFSVKVNNMSELDNKQSYVFVANHSSYIDVMLMFLIADQPFVFVGKKELVKIPFFGYLYRRAAIMVDRSSSKSRFGVYSRARKVFEKGYSVCIFPEKEYNDETILLNTFKQGAFKLAIEHQLDICPIVFLDCKRKYPWYSTHGYPGKLRVDIYPTISSKGLSEKDIPILQHKTFGLIYRALNEDPEQKAVEAIKVWKKIKKID